MRHDARRAVELQRRCGRQRRFIAVAERRDVHPVAADDEADRSRLTRCLQLGNREGRLAGNEGLGALTCECDAQREPLVDREIGRIPEAGAVVQLPGRDPVANRCVLNRVRVARLVWTAKNVS